MLSWIQNGASPPHPRGCSKRTMRLPEDGNIVRSKLQAELRAAPAAPEAQTVAETREILDGTTVHRGCWIENRAPQDFIDRQRVAPEASYYEPPTLAWDDGSTREARQSVRQWALTPVFSRGPSAQSENRRLKHVVGPHVTSAACQDS